jgi:DNA polymerase III epsilon subunit-like protein
MLGFMSEVWFRRFRDHFGFPNNYTTIDLETTGTTQDNDLICTIGAVIVRDGEISEVKHWVLNWTTEPGIDSGWLRHQLTQVQRALHMKNQPFHHTFEYLSQGRPPNECLEELLELVEDCEERGEILVAHNGWWFDVEFMQAAFHNYLRIPYVFPDDGVYDSGICEKASQLEDRHCPLPRRHESLKDFSWRIGGIRARGVMWALGGHCEEKYNLTQKANIRRGDLHRADMDALMLHYLMQEHRALAGLVALNGEALNDQES